MTKTTRARYTLEFKEISRLRAELASVKMERDILGKATAYFANAASRHPRQGQAPRQGHHRQQARPADLAEPAGSAVQRGRARQGLGGRHQISGTSLLPPGLLAHQVSLLMFVANQVVD
jgi:hypothetical protein